MKTPEEARLVGWYFTQKGCAHHYFKKVTEWRYDDATQANVYVNIGIMAMDDFGSLFVVGAAP